MATYDAIRDLPLRSRSCSFEGLEFTLGEFERLTTVIQLRGGGEEGVGEDVIYDAVDHIAQQSHGPPEGLACSGTFDEFSQQLDGIDLFPAGPPERESLAPTTAAGPSSRRRSTWRCARRGPTSPRRSAASRGR